MNREAYLAGWGDPRENSQDKSRENSQDKSCENSQDGSSGEPSGYPFGTYENILYSGIMIDDGDEDYDDMVFLEVYWPGEEDFRKLDGLVSRITGVGYCDNRVFHAVVEAGQNFFTGKGSLEETLEEIHTRVKLYLEE